MAVGKHKCILSIIIATYNSESLLPLVLSSLKKQTIPRELIEIILVDGGSSDNTLKIGKKYGCRIVKNLHKEPVTGKYLGYINAKGKYLMYLDHDEVIVNKDSLVRKLKALKENPTVKAIAGGNYVNPEGYSFINNYINDFGDPFTFFMYRLSKRNDFFYKTMRRRYKLVQDRKDYSVFDLTNVNVPIIELAAGASVFDGEILKRQFPETLENKWLLPHYYYLLYSSYPRIIVMKDDPLVHYSAESIEKTFRKISWRIRNNIFFQSTLGKSGFMGRERYGSNLFRFKKYFFPLYAFLIIPPLCDAIFLSISRHSCKYFVHVPLSLFTAISIIYNYVLRLIGVKPAFREYGS